ncbi:MAG: pyrroline-5-carboxylate reductase [Francisellaceae bacterium]|jgi:pyrroline-5-carboxylate reductase|nr:pyrroline-5-carboxylate reductase [Francisellaceae bacterium]MBT6538699.1 pyrroline-5-carboxylate reductase [Francisellaceae bacterium]
MQTEDLKIAIIGAGNMGSYIAIALNRKYPKHIYIFDRNISKCKMMTDQYGIHSSTDINNELNFDVLIIAIKPQQIEPSQEIIKALLTTNTIILTVAAGMPISFYEDIFGTQRTIIRAMPTTAAKYSQSATAAYCKSNVSSNIKDQVNELISAMGTVTWLDNEEHIHIATAIAGSGIAYYFTIILQKILIAEKLGLPTEKAEELTIQAVIGAGSMVKNENLSMNELIQQVTSPNGVTAAAIMAMKDNGIYDLMESTLHAAITRSKELGAI